MSSESKPINLGFIGLSASGGWAASYLYPALAHSSLHSTFRIKATQTSSQTSAQATAEAYNAKPGIATPLTTYYGSDASQVARDPEVDVVVISVKVPHHKKYLDAAVEAGKHYFVEYPPVETLEGTLELQRKAEEKGLKVAVGLQGRHSASIRKLKKIIDSGKIGKILSTSVVGLLPKEPGYFQPQVFAQNAYTLDPANGASLLRIPIGHQLDTLMYLLGSFTSLNARASMQHPTTTILPFDPSGQPQTVPSLSADHYTIAGQLESGAQASLVWRSGYANTPGRSHFLWIIDGEEGSIRLESNVSGPGPFTGALTSVNDPEVKVNSKLLDDYLRDEGIQFEEDPALVVQDGEKGTGIEFIRRSWVEFGKELRGGKGEFATLLDTIHLLRVLDAVEKSAAQGGTEVKVQN